MLKIGELIEGYSVQMIQNLVWLKIILGSHSSVALLIPEADFKLTGCFNYGDIKPSLYIKDINSNAVAQNLFVSWKLDNHSNLLKKLCQV